MEIKATINVARFIQAMEAKQLKVVDACAVCSVNNKTLAKILRGEFPRRIDAFYRVVNGLQIPIAEALVSAGTSQTPKLQLVHNRREPSQVA
jgi:hypothetical protein